MNRIWTRVAALLAAVIGVAAIAAGTNVLRGWQPGYTVIGWLPVYNLAAGLVSALVIAVLLWADHRFARTAAVLMLVAHGSVLLLLLTTQRETVARDSLVAMTIRIVVWIVIVILATVQRRRERRPAG